MKNSSIPSSSSSESEEASPPPVKEQLTNKTKDNDIPISQESSRESSAQSNEDSDHSEQPTFTKKVVKLDPDTAFDDFYLQQATKEFAQHLDKLRSVPDFHEERSVPILIEALRQGRSCFSEKERTRVGSGMAADTNS